MDKKKKRKEKLLNLNAIFLLRIISILGLNESVKISPWQIINTRNKYTWHKQDI